MKDTTKKKVIDKSYVEKERIVYAYLTCHQNNEEVMEYLMSGKKVNIKTIEKFLSEYDVDRYVTILDDDFCDYYGLDEKEVLDITDVEHVHICTLRKEFTTGKKEWRA